MKRAAVVVLALVGLALGAAGPATAAAPRIVLVSGTPLVRPVTIADWNRIFSVVSALGTARVVPRSELANRPRLQLALFWGPRWNAYLAGGGSPAALRPRQADQYGSYYPAYGDRAAAIDLPWAGRWPRVVPQAALRILGRFGVPTRLRKLVDTWAPFRRPLALPRLAPAQSCPLSDIDPTVDWSEANIFGGSGIGPGPVYPGLGATPVLNATPDTQFGGPWHSQKVFWYIAPSYAGPVLIRGRRLDGLEWMRFDGGTLPSPELRIRTGETVIWSGQPAGSRGRPSSVRVSAPGCYGVQIDGTTFSRTVFFEVTLSQ